MGELYEPLPPSATASGVSLPTGLPSPPSGSGSSIPSGPFSSISPSATLPSPTQLPASTLPSLSTPTDARHEQPAHASASSSSTVVPTNAQNRGSPTSSSYHRPQDELGRSLGCQQQRQLPIDPRYGQRGPQGVGGLPWGSLSPIQGRSSSELQPLQHQPKNDGAVRDSQASRTLLPTSETSPRRGNQGVSGQCLQPPGHGVDGEEDEGGQGQGSGPKLEREGEGQVTMNLLPIFYPLL